MSYSKQSGATMIEYALIITLIAVIVIAVERSIGELTFNSLQATANSVEEAGEPL
ncbi:Flp family type IVb pilin [Paraperlucidibaca baekdonensis]|uniref:Flp family type IVb pilin n=1 Tax=Paraperlucidibaca baekdonensis TaxID=748120 RepID=UPI001C6EB8FF|nr:Flp family type IVb pilin [Paraperlucidibaca baekdonensis]